MHKTYLFTPLKSRLQLIRKTEGEGFNWVFLAGGPGLGSESLIPLTDLLHLPGTIWHLDLPGDGSNLTENDSDYFSKWSEALTEAIAALDRVILVAHSTGGMYALSTPALASLLSGFVLMDSAPDASWQQLFSEHVQQNPIENMASLHQYYSENPNNETLKQLTLLSAPYLFTERGLEKDRSFLESLPYNFRTCDWSAQHFDSTYKAKWIPKNIPTLIFAGEEDCITPLELFSSAKDFQQRNIQIKSIKNAGHFPWIENPKQVIEVFNAYAAFLGKKQPAR